MSKAILGLTVLLVTASPTLAATIVVGGHPLQPDTSGQEIMLQVTGGEAVMGLDFYVQVGDGGPEMGGTEDGPIIEAVDIIGTLDRPTIFTGNNNGQTDPPDPVPQFAMATTTTQAGTVIANGLLAIVTIDTTGFFQDDPENPWDLLLSGTNGEPFFDTEFPGIAPISITNGSITIVPEPASVIMLVSMLVGLGLLRRR